MPGKQEFVPNKVNFLVCYSILHLLQNKSRFIKIPLFIKYRRVKCIQTLSQAISKKPI